MEKLTSILVVVDQPDMDQTIVEKAVRIARAFNARVELMLGDSTQACAFSKLCADRGYDEVTLYSMFRGAERAQDVILRRVLAARPDLVIKAPAGSHPLRRWTHEDNDWLLASECPAPLLLVSDRPWGEPVRFAAAVDVSDEKGAAGSRAILQASGFLVLGMHGNLDVLYSERERVDEVLRMERAVRLAQLVREFHVGSERLDMLEGVPAKTLPPVLASRGYDVLVLGAVTRREGLMAQWNTLTSRLAEATTGDVMLVQGGEGPLGASPSLRQQRPYEVEQFV